jgi:arylsulfatase A-like enzyme
MLSEEVLRIPLAVRWPEHIVPGQTSEHLVSSVDFPVTILDAASTTFNAPVDGRSLLDLVDNNGQLQDGSQMWRDDLMCETHGHHWEPVAGRAIVSERYRYAIYQYHGKPDYLDEVDTSKAMEELYDLWEDPYQLDNLANNPEYRVALSDHRRRLEEWQGLTGDPIQFD